MKKFKIVFFIVVFQLLLGVVMASSECPFTVEGKKAKIRDNCVIETREGDKLKINFTQCKQIKDHLYEFFENDGGRLYNIIVGSHIVNNSLIYNDNFISYDSGLKVMTYIPWVSCDNEKWKYKPHIKVYESKYFDEDDEGFAPSQQTENENNASTTIIIDDNKGQVNIGGQNNQHIQNINQTNNTTIINFVIDHLIGISIGSLISVSLIIYFIRKKKIKK